MKNLDHMLKEIELEAMYTRHVIGKDSLDSRVRGLGSNGTVNRLRDLPQPESSDIGLEQTRQSSWLRREAARRWPITS